MIVIVRHARIVQTESDRHKDKIQVPVVSVWIVLIVNYVHIISSQERTRHSYLYLLCNNTDIANNTIIIISGK